MATEQEVISLGGNAHSTAWWEGKPPAVLQAVTALMRTIDAYAFDYAKQGKLGPSRRAVEHEISEILAASFPARKRKGFSAGELEYASWFSASAAYMADCSYCHGECPGKQACGRAERLAECVAEVPYG